MKRISSILGNRLLIFKCKICNFFLENISFEIIFFSVEVRITAFIRHSWFITVTKLMIFKNVLLLILQSHNSIFKFFYCFFFNKLYNCWYFSLDFHTPSFSWLMPNLKVYIKLVFEGCKHCIYYCHLKYDTIYPQ